MENQVFIVTLHIPYDGGYPLGVYSTIELANNAVRDCSVRYNESPNSFEIKPVTLDGQGNL